MKRSLIATLLTVALVFAFLPALAQETDAAAKITETVNLSRPQKNMRGSGYNWDNRNDILTLDGLNIETSAEFGLRIPDGATVVLKGRNYIKATRAALTCPGNVSFKGSGSLILVAEDMGIYFYSTDDSTTARFLEGTFDITAGGNAIESDYTALSFTGSTLQLSSASPDAYAIDARTLKLYGGDITADNAMHASLSLEVRGVKLDITAAKPALSSDKILALEEVSLRAGASADALQATDAYNGENCLRTKSTANTLGSSILFGESVPGFVDVLIVLALALLIAAGIAGPFLRSRKRAKIARAALDAALAEPERPSKR